VLSAAAPLYPIVFVDAHGGVLSFSTPPPFRSRFAFRTIEVYIVLFSFGVAVVFAVVFAVVVAVNLTQNRGTLEECIFFFFFFSRAFLFFFVVVSLLSFFRGATVVFVVIVVATIAFV
jgi:hypothetical protein